ncbi:hypothetical protein KAR91_29765 [Candidatus Pacearchaeota archaeon]|nr:hypothetical protein [Candidatus Pacearchaeota archaeon]
MDDETEALILEFIEERKLLAVDDPRYLYDNDRLTNFKENWRVTPYITQVAFHDPVTRTLPQVFENNTIRVTHRDPLEIIEDVPLNNADAVYAVPAAEYKQIVEIFSDCAAVGVANRDYTLGVVKNIAGAIVVAGGSMITGAIVLTDGLEGSIWMPRNGPTWLNTNGVIANEDTNIIGTILGPGDTVTATWTNKQADDRCRLQVVAIDVPNMLVL